MPATHRYSHPEGKGFGRHHAEESGRELPAEMRDLDMPPGTEVEHADTDEDSGRPIVAWADASGNPRRTSIDPEFFREHFEPMAQDAPEGA
jgi:hypothetical protein